MTAESQENLAQYDLATYDAPTTDVVEEQEQNILSDENNGMAMEDDGCTRKRSFQATLTEESVMEECSDAAIDGEESRFELLLAAHLQDTEILPEAKRVKTDTTSVTAVVPGSVSASTSSAPNKQWSIMFERLKAYKAKYGVRRVIRSRLTVVIERFLNSTIIYYIRFYRTVWCPNAFRRTPSWELGWKRNASSTSACNEK